MKDSKVRQDVAWSDEDQCYIGYAPGLLIGGCCHGDNEKAVSQSFAKSLETIELGIDGLSLPPPTAGLTTATYCRTL